MRKREEHIEEQNTINEEKDRNNHRQEIEQGCRERESRRNNNRKIEPQGEIVTKPERDKEE